MAKITLPTVESGYLSTEALNQAFADISTALDNTVSRDGTSPNQLEADLDLNGFQLLNVGADADNPNSLLTVQQMQDYVDTRASGLVIQKIEKQTATASQTVFNLTTMTYKPGANNLAVFVNGVRKFAPNHYTENDADTITFVAGLTVGDLVVFITNSYLATVSLPAHFHAWADIVGAPTQTQRWPDWTEVTGKPTTFAAAAHNHAASEITTGTLSDTARGVFVQSAQPTGLGTLDAGKLWLW